MRDADDRVSWIDDDGIGDILDTDVSGRVINRSFHMLGPIRGRTAYASDLRIERLRLRDVFALRRRGLPLFGKIVLHRVISGGAAFLLRAGGRELRFILHRDTLYPNERRFSPAPAGTLR